MNDPFYAILDELRRKLPPECHPIVDEMEAMYEKKGRDYSTDEDPLANVRACEEFGVPAWLGGQLRANEKMQRIKTYAKKGTLSNEGVEDSLLDSAIYNVIALLLFREQKAESGAPACPAPESVPDILRAFVAEPSSPEHSGGE